MYLRQHSIKALRCAAAGGAALLLAAAATPASAQELTHRFINPSFGGNPFYSDHLLSIANIHRPAQPESPGEPPPTEEELLAAQLRSQFLSQLSGEIRQRIQNAQPGDSGQFELGDQRISFVRTTTETQITFLNPRTGEESRIVIPVASSASRFAAVSASAASAEQALGAGGTLLPPLGGGLPPIGGSTSGLLGSRSLEIPLRNP